MGEQQPNKIFEIANRSTATKAFSLANGRVARISINFTYPMLKNVVTVIPSCYTGKASAPREGVNSKDEPTKKRLSLLCF